MHWVPRSSRGDVGGLPANLEPLDKERETTGDSASLLSLQPAPESPEVKKHLSRTLLAKKTKALGQLSEARQGRRLARYSKRLRQPRVRTTQRSCATRSLSHPSRTITSLIWLRMNLPDGLLKLTRACGCGGCGWGGGCCGGGCCCMPGNVLFPWTASCSVSGRCWPRASIL